MKEYVGLFIRCSVSDFYVPQQADRRDRLIYVLSQINAARGDDIQMEEESSEESADEVLVISISLLYSMF